MRKISSLIGVVLVFAIISITESFDLKQKNMGSLSYMSDASVEQEQPVAASTNEEELLKNIVPVLELKLVDRKKEDGSYIIETYEEYEVYKDGHGEIIKSIPTGHFEYLKYEL